MRLSGAAVLLLCVLGPVAACSDSPSAPQGRPMSADAVRAFFEQDPAGRAALGLGTPTDPAFCGVDVLGGSADGRWTYAWVTCSTFTVSGGSAEEESGVSVPVRLDATARTATLPQDGTGYADSIRAMFPAPLAERALAHDVQVDRTPGQLRAAAVRRAATRTAGPAPTTPAAATGGNRPTPLPVGTATALPTSGPHRVTADEVRAVFEAQPSLGMPDPGERVFCGVDLLGQSPDLRLVYAWVDCTAYGSATDLLSAGGIPQTGFAGPYRIDLVDGTILSAEGGATYHEDLAAIFPPDVVDRVVHERVTVDQGPEALDARARKAFAAQG